MIICFPIVKIVEVARCICHCEDCLKTGKNQIGVSALQLGDRCDLPEGVPDNTCSRDAECADARTAPATAFTAAIHRDGCSAVVTAH